MDPTALPTDNLYKFAALSGVALAAFLLWLTWRIQRELESDLLAIRVKQARGAVAATRVQDLGAIVSKRQEQLETRAATIIADAKLGGATVEDAQEIAALFKDSEANIAAK